MMPSYITIKETAKLWNCSARNVQLLCKQGSIPGAKKVSGIWLLPVDSIRPGSSKINPDFPFLPEKLYGKNADVHISTSNDEIRPDESGCMIIQYQILDGITLVFQDIHEETIDYGDEFPQFPKDLIAIQHCRKGRFEGIYSNKEHIYMGPGSLSVNLPAWSPVSNSFPLKHYHGFYIAIAPQTAKRSIQKLEQILGPLQIDLHTISDHLPGKNKLAFYSVDKKTAALLSSIYPSGEKLWKEQLKLYVLELLQILSTKELFSPKPEQYLPPDQVKTVKDIREYLIAHLDQHISLTDLSSEFHISLTGMKTAFKGVYGQSIGKYLREYRIQTGAELLMSTNARIIDIAGMLGYENASKFSETFSKYFGLTPSDYRKLFCLPGVAPDNKE